MGGDERLELADELSVASECEVGLDPLLESGYTCLFEARDLVLGERVEHEVGQCRPTPLRERFE